MIEINHVCNQETGHVHVLWRALHFGRKRKSLFPHQSLGDEGGGGTYVHGGAVVLVRLPDLLHHLLLGAGAGFDGALHRDGPLGVVQGQILQAGRAR